MSRKCQSRKKDGVRCAADAQTGKNVCVFHDPDKAGDVQRARQAGGIKRSRRAAFFPPDTPDYPLGRSADVSALLADSINQLRRGQLDPRVANGVGYLASILLRSMEQGTLEQRVLNMERMLGLTRTAPAQEPETQPTEADHAGGT